MFEPSWRDDVMTIASLPLGAVATLDEELAQPIAREVGSECNMVRFTQCGAWHAQGALLLGCTRLQVIADSSRRHVVWIARHAGVDHGSRLGPHVAWHRPAVGPPATMPCGSG